MLTNTRRETFGRYYGQTRRSDRKTARFRTIRRPELVGHIRRLSRCCSRGPRVTRTSFQRVYDMVLAHGTETYQDNKKKIIHYKFFDDEVGQGKDSIFGLDIPLMRLVNVLKSAALGYGTEKRVILLHGPVGSSKSTIARLLKRGIEAYSRSPEGALYTYEWHLPESLLHITGGESVFHCPMNEEPLRLIPPEWRKKAFGDLGLISDEKPLRIKGTLIRHVGSFSKS